MNCGTKQKIFFKMNFIILFLRAYFKIRHLLIDILNQSVRSEATY